MSHIVPSISRKVLALVLGLFVLGSLSEAFAANQVEFFLRNQRPNDACTEYMAELWVTVDQGLQWDVASSNIGISYNTAALSAQNVSPAFEANPTLTADGVSITQTPGVGFARINLLKFPGSSPTTGTFKLCTVLWDITDKSVSDNLVFVTGGPTTLIFDDAIQLIFNTNDATGFGVTNPTPPRVVGGPVITGQPSSVVACEGDPASFTVEANGCNAVYDWQKDIAGVWTSTGETSATLSFGSVGTGDAGDYRVIVSADEPPDATSNTVTLTVNVPPVVTSQPQSTTNCVAADVQFDVAFTGTAPVGIQWQIFNDGTFVWDDLLNETSSTLTVTNIQASDDGNQYRSVLSNTCGTTTSDVAILTVNTPPSVTLDPNNKFVCAGDGVTFMALADGSPSPTIQWQEDTGGGFADIPGANSSSYSIPSVNQTQNGYQYRAVFTNICGVATSASVTLTIYADPVITLEPASQMVCSGATVVFGVTATSAIPLTYQWQVNSGGGFTDLGTETSATLTLTGVLPGQDGNSYRVIVANTCGSVTSSEANLTVWTVPAITSNPVDAADCVGSDVMFTAAASGSPAPTVQWQVDTGGGFSDLPGEMSPTLVVTSISVSMDGYAYRAVFSNTCGTVNSVAANLNVWTVPVVTTEPANTAVCEGGIAVFTSASTGVPTPNIQWQVDTGGGYTDITGETSATLFVSSVAAGDNGNLYRAVFSNTCGTVTSSGASLTVWTAPTISSQPVDAEVCETSTATFTAIGSGFPAPGVQWQVNTGGGYIDITGATVTTLTLVAVSASDNGNLYRAVFTNVCGSETSNVVTLTVNVAPVVSVQPNDASGCTGDTFEFTADATGMPTPDVQWQVNSGGGYVNVTGATATTLTLNNVPASADGNLYRAVFTNLCGSATSSAATLTIFDPPAITMQPADAIVCEGDDALFVASASGNPIPAIQWQVDMNDGNGWQNVSNATLNTLTVAAVTASQDGNNYRAIFSNQCGVATSSSVLLTVNTEPVITAVPQDVDACEGDNVEFMADATGQPTPDVQWQVNTGSGYVDVTGANTTTLSLTNVQASADGNLYRAVFSNTCGTVTSASALLEIDVPPVVTLNPTNQTVCEGETAFFTATASGSPTPTVQWQGNANDGNGFVNIPGKTSTTLDVTGTLRQWDGFQYRAVFSNPCGTEVFSSVATLTVNTEPLITQQPSNATICEGDNVTFTSLATSQPAATIQWQVDNGGGWMNVTSANSADLTLFAVSANADGNLYRVIYTNICGSSTSSVAVLTVNTDPVVTSNPSDVTVCEFSSVTFNASATGSPTPTVQWQVDENDGNGWQNIPNATSASLDVDNIPASSDGFQYRAVFTNVCSSAATLPATLTVNTEPVVTLEPVDFTICTGFDAVFTANATGKPNPDVQWQVNDGNGWMNLTGQTSTTLTLVAVTPGMDGNLYRASFSNVCGFDLTTSAMLTVNTPPSITQQPVNTTTCSGQSASFTVVFEGKPTPTVQWQVFNLSVWSNLANANDPTLTLNNVPEIWDGYLYRAVLTNECGQETSGAASLHVQTAPVVTVEPNNQTICEGQDVSFSAHATGDPIPTVQWQEDTGSGWSDMTGQNNTDLTLTGVPASANGNQYRAVFTNVCGTTATQPAVLTVNSNPIVLTHPQDVEVCEGAHVLFSVAASGTPAPTIQWQLDDLDGNGFEDMIGEESTVLDIGIVDASQDGYMYRVKLNNICSTQFSSVATLIVNEAPVVTLQPTDEIVCEFGAVQFTATASGQPTPAIQWQVDLNDGIGWQDLGGETSSTLSLTNIGRTLDGNRYRAVFTNVCGVAESDDAILTVWTKPEITLDPVSILVCEPNDAVFTADAVGTPNPTVQWQVSTDGTTWSDVSGATSATYSFTPTVNEDGNWYRAVFTNDCGAATTASAQLTYFLLPFITEQPQDAAICEGEDWTFTVTAGGTEISLQWRHNGVDIPGETEATLTVSNAQASDAGNYDVVITNTCASITSNVAVLTVNFPPVITAQPTSEVVCLGDPFSFSVGATGTDLEYQWEFNNGTGWNAIAGATAATYSTSSAQVVQAGDYRVVITGICPPPATSETVSLTVNIPPAIVTEPQSQTVCEGDPFLFTVNATGTDLTYQWFHNGTAITGATEATLTAPATLADAGTYWVVVSGVCPPAVQSQNVTLVVNELPSITQDPQDQVVCLDQTIVFQAAGAGTGITYQWEFSENGTTWNPIANATNDEYEVAGAQLNNEGYYRVVVSGICPPPAVSEAAFLDVKEPVELTIDLNDETVCIGDNVVFVIEATGTPSSCVEGDPLDVEWYKDGEIIPLANEKQLILTNAQESDAGHYQALVTGFCNQVWSAEAILFITPEPELDIIDPDDLSVFAGETATFEVNTNCPPGAQFQWFRGDDELQDDGRITGAQSSRLVIMNADDADASNEYYVRVTCACGTVESEFASLNIRITNVEIVEQPVDVTVCETTKASLTVGYDAKGQAVSIQWYSVPRAPVTDGTEATLCLDPPQAGTYFAEITLLSDPTKIATSGNAVVTVLQAPQISDQPDDVTICLGDPFSFDVTVANDGVEGTSYQWIFNGNALPGATTASYSTTASQATMEGNYWVIVSNTCGTTSSNTVSLTFNAETVITTQPEHPNNGNPLDWGGSYEMTVAADGTGTCSYQWQFSNDGGNTWNDIANAESTTYSDHFTTDDVGQYRVEVTCDCGTVTSNVVQITEVGPTSVQQPTTGVPFSLSQNYPNPFTGKTSIKYTLHKTMRVELVITDMMGQVVATLVDDVQAAGQHEVVFDASEHVMASGMYNYTLRGEGEFITQQLQLVK